MERQDIEVYLQDLGEELEHRNRCADISWAICFDDRRSCIQTIIAVEAQYLLICSTTRVAARWASPSPPTSFALMSPNKPAFPSASRAACG